jgi:sec-independent protein translocase protein TatC
MSILEHLEELRSRLLRAGIALVLGFSAAWAYAPRIYTFLVQPALTELPTGSKLAFTGISDPFLLYMKVAMLGGLLLSLPYVLWQLWLFVSPGLYRREKRWAIPFVVATSLFFFAGCAFAYYAVVPYAVAYFISLGMEADFQPIITVKELLSFELQMILATGAVFEMPVLVFFLTRIGIVTPAFLLHYFGPAMFIIWLIAAWVTPPDIFSMILVGTPMTLLYILSIFVSWFFKPRPIPAASPASSGPGPSA